MSPSGGTIAKENTVSRKKKSFDKKEPATAEEQAPEKQDDVLPPKPGAETAVDPSPNDTSYPEMSGEIHGVPYIADAVELPPLPEIPPLPDIPVEIEISPDPEPVPDAAVVEEVIEEATKEDIPPVPKLIGRVPGLRLLCKRRKRFWCIQKPLDPGKPLDVKISDLSEAQLLEIETKKDKFITVEEIEIEVYSVDE